MWLHSLKVAQLLRSAACLHTNQSRSYLNHLVYIDTGISFPLTKWTVPIFFSMMLYITLLKLRISVVRSHQNECESYLLYLKS